MKNYRGAKVQGIPETSIPDVLTTLGKASVEARKMPHQNATTSDVYVQLAAVLRQMNKFEEIN